MWDYKPRPPFYARPWFICLGVFFAVILIAGLGVFFYFESIYEKKAAQFDLGQLGKMETASLIFDRHGQQIGKILAENREVVPFSRISKNLVNAVIAAEDNRFYEHGGIDYMGMARAALKNYSAGKIRQGASTVTQQLARNSFSLKERTYERKIVEAFLSRRIEQNISKEKIMEYYLNRVYFGGGLYGAEAAARGYFRKSAADLSIGESATLAGILKSPNGLSPWRNPAGAEQARKFVLGRMLEIGRISQAEFNEASLLSFRVRPRQQSTGGQSYALDYIRQQITGELDFDSAASSGYRIYTTLDAKLQKIAETSLARELDAAEKVPGFSNPTLAAWKSTHPPRKEDSTEIPPEPDYLQGAVFAVESKTGGILILIGGRDYDDSQYDRSLYAKRSPGTAFTPFVFAAGFQNGLFPGTLVDDSSLDNRQVMIGGYTGILGEWGTEQEDNKYEGAIPARRAVSHGKNAATVRFGMDVGLEKVIELAKSAGLTEPMRLFPATFLGSSEATLEQLTLAYTLFPGGGARPDQPFIISRVEEADGTIVYQARPHNKKVINSAVAFEIHSFLSDVLEKGTAANASAQYRLKSFPGGGKTGTAYNFTDAWFIGYNSEITCGVWAGFDKRRPIYSGAFGNKIALPVWADIMNASLNAFKPTQIPRPNNIERVEVCLASGLPATRDCFKESTPGNRQRTTFFEFATAEQIPKGTCYVHGGTGTPDSSHRLTNSGIPRAISVVDLSTVQPIIVKGSTIIGDEDPFNSVRPTMRALPVDGSAPLLAAPAVPGTMQVRRAETVRPLDANSESPALNIEAPPPLNLE